MSRIVSIAAEKHVKPTPASEMSKPLAVVRNTPLQSIIAPSTRYAMQVITPMKVTMPCGIAIIEPLLDSPPVGNKYL